MNPLEDSIAKAKSQQYPPAPANNFQIMYGKNEKKSSRARWSDHFKLQLQSAGFLIKMPNQQVLEGERVFANAIYPEFRFHPTRRWMMDFAIPATKIHIEIEGGIWMGGGGAHSRPMNIQRDIEKQNAAVLLGWHPLRFSPKEIKEGISIQITMELHNKLLSSKTT